MQYERYALPVVAMLGGMFLGYAIRRRPRFMEHEEEVGTFVYTYPLDLEEDFEEVEGGSSVPDDVPELIDEEMFPGFRPEA